MNLDLVKSFFEPKSILDIGANTGQFYEICKEYYFPNAYYFLVEGNKECEPYIKNLKVDYSISLLSDKVKEVLFYTRKNEPLCTGNSIYRENTPFFADSEILTEKIDTTTLDLLLPERSFDLIKIDVQGSEIDIIKGGQSIVKNAKGIILEVSLVEYNFNSPRKEEVLKYMESINFYPKALIGNIMHPIDKHLIQEDILFINYSYLSTPSSSK